MKAKWILGAGVLAVILAIEGIRDIHVNKPLNYSPSKLCDDAYDLRYDFREKIDVQYFDVPMKEGCFGPWVRFPKYWHYWESAPVGDSKGYWITYWLPNQAAPLGPYLPNSPTRFSANAFRIQGHGTARFYSNVLPK